MNQSRKNDNFEFQLQHKLQNLSHTRSANKIKIKSSLLHHQYRQSARNIKNQLVLDQYSKINQNLVTENLGDISIRGKQSVIDVRPNENQHGFQSMKKSGASDIPSQGRTKKIDNEKQEILSLINDKQLAEFLYNCFGKDCFNLDLSLFLAKCLAQFSKEPTLPEEQIKLIFLELQEQITTTNPSRVSLNALQLAIRKSYNSLKLYICEKIIRSQYNVHQERLKQRQKQLQKVSANCTKNNEQKQKILSDLQKQLRQRQKQLSKRQKNYASKQRQLPQRIKNMKKIVQQRANKLSDQFVNELKQHVDKMEKKMNLYERNMKYRIQTLTQKSTEIQKQHQHSQQQQKQKMSKQIEQKLQKQYQQKNKKLYIEVKQIKQKNQIIQKQLYKSQQQCNKLTKILAKIQSKYIKQENKYKQIYEKYQQCQVQIKELKFMCEKKDMENQMLVRKVVEGRAHRGDEGEQGGNTGDEQGKKIKGSQSKKMLSNRKKSLKNGDTIDSHKKQSKLSIKAVVTGYEDLLMLNCGDSTDENAQIMSQTHAQIMSQTHAQIMGQTLGLAIKLIVQQQIICTNLVETVFRKIVCYWCSFMNSQQMDKTISTNNAIVNLTEDQPHACQQLKKYLKYLQEHDLNNKKVAKVILQLCSIVTMSCHTRQTCIQWLCYFTSLIEHPIIHQIIVQLTKSTRSNVIYSIYVMFSQQFNHFGIQILTFLSDVLMEFVSVVDPCHDCFWNYAGKRFVEQFIKECASMLRDAQYFQDCWQALQKVSIVVQRLVVNRKIEIGKAKGVLQQIGRKSKGSLLSRNLKSIIQAIELSQQVSTSNILDEIEKY